MRLTIGLRNKATLRTGARGIAWVNQLNQHASNFSFILNKAAELVESPRLVPTPLAMSNRAIADEQQKGDIQLSVIHNSNLPSHA